MLLPTEKLGHKGADLLTKLLQDFFTNIQNDPAHFVRQEIHSNLQRLRQDIPTSSVWQQRLVQFQNDLAQNQELHDLVRGMAGDLRTWLLADLQHDHSRIRLQLENAGLGLAQTLQADASLRASACRIRINCASERPSTWIKRETTFWSQPILSD